MPKETWLIACGLTVLLLLGLLGYSSYDKTRRLAQAQADLADARAAAVKEGTDSAELSSKLADAQAKIAELEKQNESAVRSHKTLEDEMRAALESKDVTISQLQGKLTVNILDRVLFNSGEADLTPGGEAVLRKVAAFLQEHPDLKIHVIGHTDNVPIRASARNRFSSNWELSTARATAAVRFLSEKAGVDPHRLGAVGYGEFRPIADNSTPEGRARNRRIAITILSGELAGADAPAASAGTNSLPAAPILETNSPVQSSSLPPSPSTNAAPQD